jgi:hypothetical protein
MTYWFVIFLTRTAAFFCLAGAIVHATEQQIENSNADHASIILAIVFAGLLWTISDALRAEIDRKKPQ